MGRGRQWSWFVVGVLLVGLLPLSTAGGVIGASTHKLVVDRSDAVTLADLQKQGARLLADYGTFTLWEVPDTTTKALVGRASVQQRDDFDDILLRNGTITPASGVPPAPANLRQSKTSGKQLWLVQFIGPIKPEWLTDLTNLGAEIVIYMPNNAYVTWVDGGQLTQIEALAVKATPVQWTGAYEPAYRLEPSLQRLTGTQMTPVTIQFYRTANMPASIAAVVAFGGAVLQQPEDILGFTNISLEVPANQLVSIANRADVFNVEPYVTPIKNDEAQGQILAGNLATSGGNVVPTGPGYLAWLASKGFPTDPAQYPVVAVVDDGIDNGTTSPLHPDFYVQGVNSNPSRLIFNDNCTIDVLGDGLAGHGNLNAGIVGGFNNGTGAANEDVNGYNYGLGISPYTRLGGVKIFKNAGPFDLTNCPGANDAGIVAKAFADGATLTSNSWGSDVSGVYTAESQAYDSMTRDASSTTAGNQQMLHVFSAGNKGPNVVTLGSPGTAKNVLTVGATENVREEGVLDGCNVSTSNNADDIAFFSSRGPTLDGRSKPDIMAPGIHIQGPASQDPGYNGNGVCGDPASAPDPRYHPQGQTLYTWSTGTSHSAPAVAGAVSLLYNYYGRILKPGGPPPSPAMLKALMLNRPRYLTGVSAGDKLPSPNQGWGDANLGDLFDTATSRVLLDQTNLLTATGNTYLATGTVASASKPLRITLAWTDAPGTTTAAPWTNDLNLEVTINGVTYKGNVFNGAWSTTGGAADAKNNVENVFIPAGVGSQFTVKVTAANIAAIGVPGGAGTVNQDFALVISNGNATAGAANLGVQPVTISDNAGGNNNGLIDPGETISLTVPFKNEGTLSATGVSATLTSASSTVTIGTGTSAYADIAAGAIASNTTPFTFTVSATQPCGVPVSLILALSYNGGPKGTMALTLPTNVTAGAVQSFASTDIPKSIPDDNPNPGANGTSNLTVGATGAVGKVVVHLSATQTFDGDFVFTLTAPDNTTVALITLRGDAGHNFTNTTLDDAAATPISAIMPAGAPFTGTFRPEQPLATFIGRPLNGTWTMNVSDRGPGDTGSLVSWSLDLQPGVCTAGNALQISSMSPTIVDPNGGTVVHVTGAGFTGAAVTVDGVPVIPTSLTDTQITLTMPPHPAGSAIIAVTTFKTVTTPITYGSVNPLPSSNPTGGSPGSPGVQPNPRPGGTSAGSPPGTLPNPRP